MFPRWIDFIGLSPEGKYPLIEFLGEDAAGIATFRTGNSRMVRCIASDAPAAAARAASWRTGARLSHPNLITVETVGETELDFETVVYAVMELPEDSLAQVIPERGLTSAEAGDAARPVLEALLYLHQLNLVHGSLSPAAIVAMGDRIKLTLDTLAPGDPSADMRAFGAALVEMLTQRRDAPADSLPSHFRELAAGCLSGTWTAQRALDALAAPPARQPAPTRERRRGLPAIAAAALVGAALLGWWTWRPAPEVAPARQAVVERPAPVDPASPPVVSQPLPAAPDTSTRARTSSGTWAVVAAIYSEYSAADRRSRSIREQTPEFDTAVFPERGKGQKYMVLLGSGLARAEADRLRNKAIGRGLPRDTYVTKIRQD